MNLFIALIGVLLSRNIRYVFHKRMHLKKGHYWNNDVFAEVKTRTITYLDSMIWSTAFKVFSVCLWLQDVHHFNKIL